MIIKNATIAKNAKNAKDAKIDMKTVFAKL